MCRYPRLVAKLSKSHHCEAVQIPDATQLVGWSVACSFGSLQLTPSRHVRRVCPQTYHPSSTSGWQRESMNGVGDLRVTGVRHMGASCVRAASCQWRFSSPLLCCFHQCKGSAIRPAGGPRLLTVPHNSATGPDRCTHSAVREAGYRPRLANSRGATRAQGRSVPQHGGGVQAGHDPLAPPPCHLDTSA